MCGSPAEVVADLDEVAVRIPDVDAEQSADCAGAFHGTVLDGHTMSVEFGTYVRESIVRDEADVGAARCGTLRLGLELLADLVEVDLTPSEGQRLSVAART